MNNTNVLRSSLLSILLVFFVGCATVPKEAERAELLRAAANEYWKLRIGNKYEAAYGMEDRTGLPEFDVYREQANLSRKFKLESFSINRIDIDGTRGRVSVTIIYKLNLIENKIPGSFPQTLYEEWIFRDGKWLHIFGQQ